MSVPTLPAIEPCLELNAPFLPFSHASDRHFTAREIVGSNDYYFARACGACGFELAGEFLPTQGVFNATSARAEPRGQTHRIWKFILLRVRDPKIERRRAGWHESTCAK